jgi:hypothetical protein
MGGGVDNKPSSAGRPLKIGYFSKQNKDIKIKTSGYIGRLTTLIRNETKCFVQHTR